MALQDTSFQRYVLNELQKIGASVQSLVTAAPQASATAPPNPLIGTLRYATGAWAASLGGEGQYVYEAGGWTPFTGKPNSAFGTVSSLAVTETVATAIGLNLSITPNASGQVVVIASGNSTPPSGTAWFSLWYGTGSPPAAGTNISTATMVGGERFAPFGTTGSHVVWSTDGLITGLTPGTEYWFDVAFRVTSASTTTVSSANGTAYEL